MSFHESNLIAKSEEKLLSDIERTANRSLNCQYDVVCK